MTISKRKNKIAKLGFYATVFLLCFTVAFLSSSYVPALAGAPTYTYICLDSATLPTGTPDTLDTVTGLKYSYSDILGTTFANSSGSTSQGYLSVGFKESRSGNSYTGANSISFKTDSNNYSAGDTFEAWIYIKLPEEISSAASGDVQAKMSYTWNKNKNETIGSEISCNVGIGSYDNTNNAASGISTTTGGTSTSATDSTTVNMETSWVSLTSGNQYLVLAFTMSIVSKGTWTVNYTQATFSNIALELFVSDDGSAPTINPWSIDYHEATSEELADNTIEKYIRASDNVNFIRATDETEASITRFVLDSKNITASAESVADMVDTVSLYSSDTNLVNSINTLYNKKYDGRVFCQEYQDSADDNGINNDFRSGIQKSTKVISFIVYDYYFGLNSVSISYGDSEIQLSGGLESAEWGNVYSETFAYSSAANEISKSGNYRGMKVILEISQQGSFTVTASDNNGRETNTSFYIGGMDIEAPEVPEMYLYNNTSNSSEYVNTSSGDFYFYWQISAAESELASDVIYSYAIFLYDEDSSKYNLITSDTINSARITVLGSTIQPISLMELLPDGTTIGNGKYMFMLWAKDAAGNIGVSEATETCSYAIATEETESGILSFYAWDGNGLTDSDFSTSWVESIHGDNKFINYTGATGVWTYQTDGTKPQFNISYTTSGNNYSGEWIKGGKRVTVEFSLKSSISVPSGVKYYYKIGSNGVETAISGTRINFSTSMNDTVYFWAVSGVGIKSETTSQIIRIDTAAPTSPPTSESLLDYDINDQLYFDSTLNMDSFEAYNMPWDMLILAGVDDDDTTYINDYVFIYRVSAVTVKLESGMYVVDTVLGKSKDFSFGYSAASTYTINLFEDGYSSSHEDNKYTYKYIEICVQDQAGNSSAYATYIVKTAQPQVTVTLSENIESSHYIAATETDTAKFARMYNGSVNAPADMFNYTIMVNGIDAQTFVTHYSDNFADGAYFDINFSAVFADKNCGENKTITISDLVFAENSVGYGNTVYALSFDKDYNLDANAFVADVVQVKVTVDNLAFVDKIYDGTTAVTLRNASLNFVPEDKTVSVIQSELDALGIEGITFAFENAAVNRDSSGNVIVRSVKYSGTPVLTSSSAAVNTVNFELNTDFLNSLGAKIKPKELVIDDSNLSADDKEYDGNDSALNAVLGLKNFVFEADSAYVEPIFTATFNNANVGSDKRVTFYLTGIKAKGDNSTVVNNYTVIADSSKYLIKEITQKTLAISSIKAKSKTYDGTSAATLLSYELSGFVGNDKSSVSLSVSDANFVAVNGMEYINQANVGQYNIYFTGLMLKSNLTEGSTIYKNYKLVSTSVLSTAKSSITPKTLTVSVSSNSREYDGTIYASNPIITINWSDVILGDSIYIGTKHTGSTANPLSTVSYKYIDGGIEKSMLVDILGVYYYSSTASATSRVRFVYAGFEPYDSTNTAHSGQSRYNLEFEEYSLGEYVKVGDNYVFYDASDATHVGLTRYIIDTATLTEDTANSYVIVRNIYNMSDGSLNSNYDYIFEYEGIAINKDETPDPYITEAAEITTAEARATLKGVYVKDKSGAPYVDAEGNYLYVKYFVYGAGEVVLSDDSRVVPYAYGYDVKYVGYITVDGVEKEVDLFTTDTVKLNKAQVKTLNYATLNVNEGGYTLEIYGATCDKNYIFADRFDNLQIYVIPTDVYVTVTGTFSKKFNESITLSDYKIAITGLKNNQKIANVIGFTPVIGLAYSDGTLISSENGIIAGGTIARGTYDIVINLTPAAGYSFDNYKLVLPSSDADSYFVSDNVAKKLGAFSITKTIYNGVYIANSKKPYSGTTDSWYPLALIGTLPEGKTEQDMFVTINRLTAEGEIDTTFDTISFCEKIDGLPDSTGLVNAGSYKIVYKVTNMESYDDFEMSAVLTIKPKSVTITLPATSYEKIYDGTAVNMKNIFKGLIKVSDSGISEDDLVVQYCLTSRFYDTVPYTLIKDAGTYYCRWYYAGNDNISEAKSSVLSITIKTKTIKISITSDSIFNYYDYFDDEGNSLVDENGDPITFKGIEYSVDSDSIDLAESVHIQYYFAYQKPGSTQAAKYGWYPQFTAGSNTGTGPDCPTAVGTYPYKIICTDTNYNVISNTNTYGIMEIGYSTVYKGVTVNDTEFFASASVANSAAIPNSVSLEYKIIERQNSDGVPVKEWTTAETSLAESDTANYTLNNLFDLNWLVNDTKSNNLSEAYTFTVPLVGSYSADDYTLVHISSTGIVSELSATYVTENGITYCTFSTNELGTFAVVEAKKNSIFDSSLIGIIIGVGAAAVVFLVILIATSLKAKAATKEASELLGRPVDEKAVKLIEKEKAKEAKHLNKAGKLEKLESEGNENKSDGLSNKNPEDAVGDKKSDKIKSEKDGISVESAKSEKRANHEKTNKRGKNDIDDEDDDTSATSESADDDD